MVKIPKKRNGYYYIDDKEYVSVTKVLGETLNKYSLFIWGQKMAAQIALKNPSLTEKEVLAEVQLYTKSTQARGHYIHELAENMPDCQHLINPDKDEECHGYIKALESFWAAHKPEIIGKEIELYSDKYMVAGRCDCVANINGVKWLLDYKTGKAVYKETDLQLAIYKEMLWNLGIIRVDYTGVVLLKEDGSFVFQETKGKLQDFLNVLEVWKWIKRKE